MYPFRRADRGYLKTEIEYNHQGRSKASDVWVGDVGGLYMNNYNKAFCD
jgi:hypothetical protein